MIADDLRATFLSAGLSDEQIAQMVAAGQEHPFTAGTELFTEGAPATFLWILLEGEIQMSRHVGREDIALMVMQTPGQWAGGLMAWGDVESVSGYRATGRAITHGRMFRMPSEDLARLVTEWFPFGKHMINGIYQTVRSIEATARQRESLVALGTLAAGLAHELNNPASASLRAVAALRSTCDEMLRSLSRLAAGGCGAEQFVELDALRRELAIERMAQDAVARMDREEELGSWLEQHKVTGAWDFAAQFASAGADTDWLERVDAAIGRPLLADALAWAAATGGARDLLADLTDTTNRISNLVGAVKSYSQMDRASRQLTDLHEGIESTLVMLGHKLERVEVTRDFDPELPDIDAYPGELNQVWTNLIDNAVDAMDGEGTLRISTQVVDDAIVVDIADSGRGIDTAVRDRVFEPFFTTKEVGKGTGLGLDISRRIVAERHGGDISFDSQPGSTVVHVRLPIHH